MGEIKIAGFLCERCTHKWISRSNSEKKPVVCPKCKSPYWNLPRKNNLKRDYEKNLLEKREINKEKMEEREAVFQSLLSIAKDE